MSHKKNGMFIGLILLALFIALPVAASDVTLSYYYRPEQDPDMPGTLYVGWIADCGDYSIRLLQQPVLTKSNNYLVADEDTKYLVLRVAITNKKDESVGWLAPDSFTLQDIYMGRIYGTYSLNIPESSKVAAGFHQEVFFSEIKPEDTLYTSLVFSVYPDVTGWILTFSPHSFGHKPDASVRFRIPYAIVQD